MKQSELRKRMFRNEDHIKYLDSDLRVLQAKFDIEFTRFLKKIGLIDYDDIFEKKATIGKLFQDLPESSPIKKAYDKHFKHFLAEMFFNLSIENDHFKIEVFINNDEYIVLDEDKAKIKPLIEDIHKAIEEIQVEYMAIQQKYVDMRYNLMESAEDLTTEKNKIQSELQKTQLG
ncbi:hypothetical protein [Rummeliibacillus suwonensis]|uniref:hypothetical protein n=1 Tax=Rummeliibacillus suwonensis TaxID=1306154 RepID=UPI001AAF23D6|nr:hypothetical protein [Rummeliibacillus suwonensis]MBO2537763.1 hypothetical protein [Rummeliibacillus suwonensis]